MANKNKQKQTRQAAKESVRQATASGQAASSQQVKALAKAGVNTSNARKLLTANTLAAQSAQRQAAAVQSQQQMATSNPNLDNVLRNRANQGLSIGQDFFDSPEGQAAANGMSAADVAKYATEQGFGLGEDWMNQYGTSNYGKLKISDAKNLGEALRIAAAQGKAPNIVDRKELRYMTEEFDKSGLNILGRMDKLNERATKRGMNPLGIKSSLYNKINSGKYGDTMYRPMGKYEGALAQNLFAMNDKTLPRAKDQAAVTIPGAGKMPRGFGVFGRYNDQPIFSQGVGKNWSDTKWGRDQTATYEPWYQPPEVIEKDPTDPNVLSNDPDTQDPVTADSGQFGAGADLTSNAISWTGAKGRRAKAGKGAQGYGSMRIAPSYSFGVGTNFG